MDAITVARSLATQRATSFGPGARGERRTATSQICSRHYTFLVHREYRTETTGGRRAVAGARLTSISVAAGALATIASLAGVAYVATVGSMSPRPSRGAVLRSDITRGASLVRRIDGAPEGSARPLREQKIGDIVLIDVGAQIVSLDEELDRQRGLALRNHQHLLVWLVVEDCKPCNAIEAALPTPKLQAALAGTRLVRLDAVEFLSELSRLGVPTNAFPAFVLFGPDGHAKDYLHGGEWDDDLPDNIAPVLKSFIDGTYSSRRSPWHGGPHEDETAI